MGAVGTKLVTNRGMWVFQRGIDPLRSKDVLSTESFHRFEGELCKQREEEKRMRVIKYINNIAFTSFLT